MQPQKRSAVLRNKPFTLLMGSDGRYSSLDGGVSHIRWEYVLMVNGEIIFSDDDFHTTSYTPAGKAMVSLLLLLGLQEGGTDSEYFEGYTPKQIEFRDSEHCDDLNLLRYDFEEDGPLHHRIVNSDPNRFVYISEGEG